MSYSPSVASTRSFVSTSANSVGPSTRPGSGANTPDLQQYEGFHYENCSSSRGSRTSQTESGNQSVLEKSADPYVLVTGGLGYIGSHTVLELLLAGHRVFIVDNLQNSKLSVLDSITTLYQQETGKKAQLEFSMLDYRDPVGMNHIFRSFTISAVIHFAAYKAVAESIVDPMKYYQNNVAGFIDFLQLMRTWNVRTLIYSSSATVYGTIGAGRQLVESDLPAGMKCDGISNAYGRSKWMCEGVLADLCASDASWSITALRYFNPVSAHPSGLLGESPNGFPNNLMPVLSKVLLAESDALTVFGSDWETHDGSGVRDFIHVVDLAKGHVAALSSALTNTPSKSLKVFNLGSGTGHSVLDVVKAMETASGQSIPLIMASRRPGDFASVVANPEAAELELNWKTTKSLDDICVDTWRFLRRQKLAK